MFSIKPVSDLQNYSEIRRNKTINNYEKKQAEKKLVAELVKGQKAGETQGWEKIEDVEAALGIQ